MRFERLTSFSQVPWYLFEQVKGRSWSVERLYNLAPLLLANDANRFWVLVNGEQVIKGILWVVLDALSEKLNVIVCSGIDLKVARDFLRRFIEDYNKAESGIKLKQKINWITAEPEKLIKMGGRRPKTILVEV